MTHAEHGDVTEELRLLALAALDRFEPGARAVLAGLRVEAAEAAQAHAGTAEAAQEPAACQWCPLCAVIALVRGDRPELAGRVAEHAEGLLTALRSVLEPAPQRPAPDDADAHPTVQHIEVTRC
jgi:hypothetical protein